MFNATDVNNQPPVTQMPEQPQQKFQFVPTKKRFSMPKIPVVAQVSGLLSLLLLGAGLLTVNQLSQTSQDLSSQAANEGAKFDWETPTATLAFNQEKVFYVILTPQPNVKASAAVVRVRTANEDLIEMVDADPAEGMPVLLKDFALEIDNIPTRVWAISVGANPGSEVTTVKKIAAVKIKAKNKAGRAQVDISSSSEVAVFGRNTNANTDDYKPLQITISETGNPPPPSGTTCWNLVKEEGNQTFWPNSCKGTPPNNELVCNAINVPLTIDEKQLFNIWKSEGAVVPPGCDPNNPPATVDACVSKTAAKVDIAARTPLLANDKVKPGDVVEYTILIGKKSDTNKVAIDDRFPTSILEYVGGSAKLDGGTVSVNSEQIKSNILQLEYEVGAADRGKQNKLTYQVRVKPGTEGASFSNHATVTFNGSASDSCEIDLGVLSPDEEGFEFRATIGIQGLPLDKGGIEIPGEITLVYQHPREGKIINTYPVTFVKNEGARTVTSKPIRIKGMDNTIAQTVEVYAKTSTTLRKKVGTHVLPAGLSSAGLDSTVTLTVGDFVREPAEQLNKFRLADITKMRNQYKDVSNAITDKNKEFDVNYDGVFNFTDYTIVYNNYKQILLEGDTP